MQLMWLVGAEAVHVLLFFSPSAASSAAEPLNPSPGPSGRPAGQGRPGRAGPGRSSGGTCCGPDRSSGRRAGLLPSRLGGAGRAGPGPVCTWTRAGSRGFGVSLRRRRLRGYPTSGAVLLPRPTHLRPRRTALLRPPPEYLNLPKLCLNLPKLCLNSI
jgi:hypothetical protein